MSLEVEELKKMSIKKLEAFADACDAEDKTIVEEVIASKKKSIAAASVTSEIVPDLEASQRMREQLEAQEAERLERKAKREEEIAKARAEREEAKIKAAELRDIKAAERLKAQEAKIEAGLLAKKAKEEEKAARLIEKEKQKEEKAVRLTERFANIVEKMKDGGTEIRPSKTAVIKQCIANGMTNKEIAEQTGFSPKFICDTVWRIEQQIKAAEYLAAYRAKQSVKQETQQNV